ncbi:MAG TPA: hypothetical protein VK907_08575, partial [Phnomibacter sp.]|nr:hypothetical protein [Phnomibacter sp.]
MMPKLNFSKASLSGLMRLACMLTLLIGLGYQARSQSGANCQIDKTGCPPADLPVSVCADKTENDVVGANVSWTPPTFTLSCDGQGGPLPYAYVQSFDLPAGKLGCWEYNDVQRVGNDGGVLRLWQGTGSPPPVLTTPAFFLQGSTNVLLRIASVQDFTMTVTLVPETGPEIAGQVINIPNTSGVVTDYAFTVTPPLTGSYRLKFVFTDGNNNSNYIDVLAVNAPVLGGCDDDVNFSVVSNYLPGDFFPVGTTKVIYTATYRYTVSGNTTATIVETCEFDVVVDPNTPTITCPQADLTFDADNGVCYARRAAAALGVSAINSCGSETPTIKYYIGTAIPANEISFPYDFPVGTTNVRAVATNALGVTDECTFNVVVADKQAPVLTGTLPTGQTGMNLCLANIPAGPTADDIKALYTDNCGTVSVTKNTTPGGANSNCAWTVTYTYEVKDQYNNTVSPSPAITYSGGDKTAPTLKAGQTIPSGGTGINACSAPVGPTEAEIAALYEDNCGGAVTVTKNGTPTGNTAGWSVTYTYEVKDACNNIVSPSPTISYSGSDKTNPVITTCAPNKTINTNSTCQATVPNFVADVVANDACGSVTITQSPAIGSPVSPTVGTPITVTITVEDLAGNKVTCTATLTVIGPIVANNDENPVAISGFAGGTAIANILDNDRLNCGAATTANVDISVVTPASNAGVVLNTTNGEVTVDEGTPAGVYTIVYRICEKVVPTNCAQATITVNVRPGDADVRITKTGPASVNSG